MKFTGYEICGMENIPSGPALLIYYHGAIPIDYYYLLSGIYLYKQRLLWGVGDRFLQKLPGFPILMEVNTVDISDEICLIFFYSVSRPFF